MQTRFSRAESQTSLSLDIPKAGLIDIYRRLPEARWFAGLRPPGGSRAPVIGAKALTAALKEEPFPHMAHRACKPAGVRQRTGLLLFRYPCAHSPDIECYGAWD